MQKVYPWQQSYQDALLELNQTELRTKIARAVSELEKRIRELMPAQDADSVTERQAIADALHGLGALKKIELPAPFEPPVSGNQPSRKRETL